jgi:hypothetical protein
MLYTQKELDSEIFITSPGPYTLTTLLALAEISGTGRNTSSPDNLLERVEITGFVIFGAEGADFLRPTVPIGALG